MAGRNTKKNISYERRAEIHAAISLSKKVYQADLLLHKDYISLMQNYVQKEREEKSYRNGSKVLLETLQLVGINV
jgi:hypothetical protein